MENIIKYVVIENSLLCGILLCEAKMQYLLTLQVRKYCLLALQNSFSQEYITRVPRFFCLSLPGNRPVICQCHHPFYFYQSRPSTFIDHQQGDWIWSWSGLSHQCLFFPNAMLTGGNAPPPMSRMISSINAENGGLGQSVAASSRLNGQSAHSTLSVSV